MTTEGYLEEVKKAIERLLATDDGKLMMEFMEGRCGINRPIPSNNLPMMEGARRAILLIKAISDCPQKKYIDFCKQEGDRWFK